MSIAEALRDAARHAGAVGRPIHTVIVIAPRAALVESTSVGACAELQSGGAKCYLIPFEPPSPYRPLGADSLRSSSNSSSSGGALRANAATLFRRRLQLALLALPGGHHVASMATCVRANWKSVDSTALRNDSGGGGGSGWDVAATELPSARKGTLLFNSRLGAQWQTALVLLSFCLRTILYSRNALQHRSGALWAPQCTVQQNLNVFR